MGIGGNNINRRAHTNYGKGAISGWRCYCAGINNSNGAEEAIVMIWRICSIGSWMGLCRIDLLLFRSTGIALRNKRIIHLAILYHVYIHSMMLLMSNTFFTSVQHTCLSYAITLLYLIYGQFNSYFYLHVITIQLYI